MKQRLILWIAFGIVRLALPSVAAPDRAQFLRECLDATETPETPKFDDYTKGSYHIDKLDLVQGLEAATKFQPGRLRAAIIFGPSGPLWAYHAVIALTEGDSVRLNLVVMPHARITAKGSTTQSAAEFERLLTRFTTSKLLPEGDPSTIKVGNPRSRDFAYDILVATWTEGRRSLRFAKFEKLMSEPKSQADAEALLNHLNTALKSIKTTYPKESEATEAQTAK